MTLSPAWYLIGTGLGLRTCSILCVALLSLPFILLDWPPGRGWATWSC